MFLLKIGIFKVNISSIFSLVLGIAIGLALFTLIYLAYVLRKMKSNTNKISIVPLDDTDINNSKISKKEKKLLLEKNRKITNAGITEQMIHDYENMLLDNNLRDGMGYVEYTKILVSSLITNIAKLYFPNSKRPYGEITVQEGLELIEYISKRISEMLQYSGLRFIGGIKLKTIINVKNFKNDFEKWKIVRIAQKYKLNKVLFGLKIVLNFVNPLYWVRKLIIDNSIRIVTRNMCYQIIGIAGEEAYKIYSKSVFDHTNVVNTNDIKNLVTKGGIYEG